MTHTRALPRIALTWHHDVGRPRQSIVLSRLSATKWMTTPMSGIIGSEVYQTNMRDNINRRFFEIQGGVKCISKTPNTSTPNLRFPLRRIVRHPYHPHTHLASSSTTICFNHNRHVHLSTKSPLGHHRNRAHLILVRSRSYFGTHRCSGNTHHPSRRRIIARKGNQIC